jgi:hypothetical protein
MLSAPSDRWIEAYGFPAIDRGTAMSHPAFCGLAPASRRVGRRNSRHAGRRADLRPPAVPSAGSARCWAERGFAVPDRPGLRPRTLTDVCAYAEAEDSRCGSTHRDPSRRPGRTVPAGRSTRTGLHQDGRHCVVGPCRCHGPFCDCITMPGCTEAVAGSSSDGHDGVDQAWMRRRRVTTGRNRRGE